ncbi:MAG: hypothetical protein JXA22_07280 [Candidatus Thermoplasmatota archaeon]|nr:hypothetical protein [Candidatus Thermoplasmatota archaeon]
MRKVFLVSFDSSSDGILEQLAALLSCSHYPILYRTTAMDDFSMLGPGLLVKGQEDLDEEALLGEDRRIYETLSGIADPLRRNTSAHLLSSGEVDRIDVMSEAVERGDLVLSMIDIGSRERIVHASHFSSRVMSRDAFSLCLVSKMRRFRDFKEVQFLNRELLDLSMGFHGVVCLSPRVTMTGSSIDIAHMIRHLTEMTFRSGVINLDQADLMTTLKGGSMLVMTWGAARPGGDPATTSIKDALSNPLCQIDLSTVRKALVNVAGSSELTLEDSLVASEVLRKRVRPDCRIIWGVSVVEENGEDQEVFLILATTPMELLTHWYSIQS